jgi:hypothetical protein
MNFITIKESHYASDLYELKSKLESEGITCRIKDELSAQVMNHLPTMTAQLQVAELDLAKTTEIMKAYGISEVDNDSVFCPKCGSLEFKTKSKSISFIKIFFLIIKAAFFLKPLGNLFHKTIYICDICDNEFSSIPK